MAYPNNPQLNLASILQTLSNGTQATSPPQDPATIAHYFPNPSGSSLPFAPSIPQQLQPPYHGVQAGRPDPHGYPVSSNQTPALGLEAVAPGRPGSAPPVDPRTIVSWPPALRHVTRLVAQNEAAAAHIRRLIESQHKHEREWHRAREQLIATQRTRKDAEDKVADVLRSIGGLVAPSKGNPTPEEDQEELRRYDAKVYRACKDMQSSMTAELEGLRIPFFCIRPELVGSSLDTDASTSEDGPGQQDRLLPEQLDALKKRIVELLEDMCKD